MTSQIIDVLAEGIKETIDSLANPVVKGYKWPPKSGQLDSLPAGVVYVPRGERVDAGPDIPEDHLGSRDWFLDYPVFLYFAADDLAFAQAQIAEAVEAYVMAVDLSMDAGNPMNDLCDDVKVVRWEEPVEATTESNRKLWMVESRVRVVKYATY